jgi:hypothetical protein
MKSKSFLISAIILISAIVALNPSIAKADILVYDNDNQYLGILLELGGENLDVFIPSLGASWKADYDEGDIEPCPGSAYFENSSCTGTPYENDRLPAIQDLSGSSLAKFYVVDFNSKKTFVPGSYIDSNCDCQVNSFYPWAEHYQLIEVQMPFTTPVALPLSFKVQTITETVTKTETVMFPIVVPLRQKPKP